MGHNGAEETFSRDEVEGSETIEIKIKTLDSHTYSLRVNKQMPVPDLKEQIASVTGVLSEQQRLICRGRVLKDDQLLSAYHVEDGHTLHLVVRQPPVFDGSMPGSDPDSSTNVRQGRQMAPNIVSEPFNMPDQADGVPAEFNQIFSAVLGPFAIPSVGNGSEGVDIREHGPQRLERTMGPSHRLHSAFGLPAAVSWGSLHHPVLPDSLATLSQYRSYLSHQLGAIGRDGRSYVQAPRTERESNSAPLTETVLGLPTPAALAEVILATRQMLIEQAAECLHQLFGQLVNQVNLTDPSVRSSTQSTAWRTGSLLYNLGAFLLELGRATMTLRLGQTPSEAVVNAGPAVFISPAGPNPLMVQPFPFLPGPSLGAVPMGTIQSISSLVTGIGHPRGHDVQIRRGSSTAIPNANQEENGDAQHPSGQGNQTPNSGGDNIVNQEGSPEDPSFVGDQGVRSLPVRTIVSGLPASNRHIRSESSSSRNSRRMYSPFIGRVERASGHVTHEQGAQPSHEHHPISIRIEPQHMPEPTMQQEYVDPPRDGSMPALGPHEPTQTRSFNISVLSAEGIPDDRESERELPSSIINLLRTLFPGGEIHVEDVITHGAATNSVAHQTETSPGAVNAPEVEPRPSEEGIFLSNLLHEIMPSISQLLGTEPNIVPAEEANAAAQGTAHDSPSTVAENSGVGTSQPQNDLDPGTPNSKRHKTE